MQSRNTPMYVEMVGKFNLVERYGSLLAIAQNQPNEQLGIDAMKLLLERDAKLALPGLKHDNVIMVLATVQAIGNAGQVNAQRPACCRSSRTPKPTWRCAGRRRGPSAATKPGAQELIKLAQVEAARQGARNRRRQRSAHLDREGHSRRRREAVPAAARPRTRSRCRRFRDLVKQKGNAGNGKHVFAKQGTCANCHIVNGEGKERRPEPVGDRQEAEPRGGVRVDPLSERAHQPQLTRRT